MTAGDESRLEETGMGLLSSTLGVTRIDKLRNEKD
jgi:hypothetical protein